MVSTDIERRLLAVLEAAAPEHDVDIVDVEVVGSSKAPVVRVRNDHADEDAPTISLDEVAEQSGWVNEVIDAEDPFPGSYTLEVSSPGLSRPLRKPHDFERFAGENVSLSTTAREGRRRYTGRLEGLVDGKVVLECDGEAFSFGMDEIKSCKIKPYFD